MLSQDVRPLCVCPSYADIVSSHTIVYGVGCWESAGQNGKPTHGFWRRLVYQKKKASYEQIKHRKLSKYCHWKRRSDSVFLATIEGEIEAKCFHGRRRTAWIDNVRRWTGDNMNVARTKCNGKKIRLLVAGCLRVVRHTTNNNTIIACPYQILWQNLGGVKKCDFRPISSSL